MKSGKKGKMQIFKIISFGNKLGFETALTQSLSIEIKTVFSVVVNDFGDIA